MTILLTCAVKFLSSNQFEFQFAFAPAHPPVRPPPSQPLELPGFDTLGTPPPPPLDLLLPKPGGGPREVLFIAGQISCWVLSDQLVYIKKKNIVYLYMFVYIHKSYSDCKNYLGKFWLLDEGLKLHVDDEVSPSDGISVGEFLLAALEKISASFGVGLIDNGDLATLPGVILGSSSMLFICEPLN